MNVRIPYRGRTRSLSVFLRALAAPVAALSLGVARAQVQRPSAAQSDPGVEAEETTLLSRVVISATRTPTNPEQVPSSVTVLALDQLNAAQVPTLSDALARVPGVTVLGTGGYGSQNSVFVRGGSSHHTLFFVDGVPMSSRSASYNNLLGGADLVGLDRIEILRGPQSTLYGSSALGGVILLETTRGCGELNGTLSATAGSFETWGGSATGMAGSSTLGLSASVAHLRTENDRLFNAYEQTSGSARLEWQVSPRVLVGSTYRGQRGEYEEPGSVTFPSQGQATLNNHLTTAYVAFHPADTFHSRLTVGVHDREYLFASGFGTSTLDNTRQLLEWQSTWDPASWLELVGGISAEKVKDRFITSWYEDDRLSEYLSANVALTPALTFTAGVRHDEYDRVEGATTGRAGASWRIQSTRTKFRATYGTAFQAPGADDRFGVPAYGQLGNPDLNPERSRGWDVGVDQELLSGRVNFGLTYFKNRFKDLFDYEIVDFTTFAGRIVNRTRASTQGVEFSVDSRWTNSISTQVSYTYLDARDEQNNRRLIRRPRHQASGDVLFQATSDLRVGAGLRAVADRVEGGARIEDFTTVRLVADYRLRNDLRLKVRVENALDEEYAEVLGYPALPIAVHGSIAWQF